MIEIVDLTKKFDEVIAVDKLNLKIPDGEIFGFLGPNGAGKTTTIKLLTGLLKPTAGRAIVGGYDIQTQARQAKQIFGLIPDRGFVYPKLTGREFLAFMAKLYQVNSPTINQKIDNLFKLFELTEWENYLIESYSHGMQQKLLMAGMLLHEPRVIFLDEPMVGLDPKSGRLMKLVFKELSHQGVTIFMSTHTLEIANALCDRIGIIHQGRLIALGSKEELRAKTKVGGDLEDIFLELTGGTQYAEFVEYLTK